MKSRLIFNVVLLLGVFSLFTRAEAALDPELKKLLAVMNVGTAFVVAPGFIVTNKHVVGDDKQVLFMRQDQTTFEGDLVLDDANNDLALFYVDPEKVKLVPLPLADDRTGMGAQVFTIGFPHPSVLGISPKLTMGHINAERGFEDNPNTFQISVPLQSGNSGGPLVDMQGGVVGITSWKLNAERMFKLTGDVPQNVNYAVKVELIKNLLNSIPLKWKTRQKNQSAPSLESLVKSVQSSVFIVLAGEKDINKLKPNNLDPVKGKMFVDSLKQKQDVALIVYAQPGAKEMNKSDRREMSLGAYSNVMSKMISKEIKLLSKNHARVSFKLAGQQATRLLYIADDKRDAQAFCKRHNVNLILTVDYDNDTVNWSPNVASMRLFDCASGYQHKKQQAIRHNYADTFSAEFEMRDFIHNFFGTLPNPINWVGRE